MSNKQEISLNTVAQLAMKNRFPHVATIELLSICNFRCIHCYIPKHDNAGMPYANVIDLLHQLREMGTFSLVLTGGEIFLRHDIMNIISVARKMGFSVSLLSNASLLNEGIIRELAELYINSFSTTVFSLNPIINDMITGSVGSLEPLLENVLLLRKYNIRTEVKTPLMKYNAFAYRQLIPFCEKHGLQYTPSTLIMPRSNGDKSVSALRLSDADFAVVLDEIETLLSGSKDSQQHFDCDGLPCPSIRNSISIDCMGNIYPCNSRFYKVGNINETTLADIWNHSEGYRYLNSLRNSDLHECCSCDLRDCCTRCPGNALLEDGDMLKCSTLDRRYALLSSRR